MRAATRTLWRTLLAGALAVGVVSCGGGSDGPSSPGTTPPPTTPPTTPPVTPPSNVTPPAVSREFRGLWVATVANIDWPSNSGLTVAQQQAELRVILDRAQSLRMNAVILQVRAAGDALYRSSLEPWMRSLTGTQGSDPGWDPLAFAVTEAHDRGLELHAWFNPFRAGNLSDTTRLAPNHLWRARPDLGRIAQNQLWFDPGEPEVQEHVIRVIRDVLSRYDVDAVHLDDYFYPYPVSGAPRPTQFPDDASYARYLQAGGTPMARDDWRRQNVNRFIERLYREVRAAKPMAKVGISPFGIWRPGNPAGIVGLDSYADIFADSRLWLQNGWMDYFAPQLYWSIASTGQSFPALLDWWMQNNAQRRHVWPGLAAYRVADGTGSAFVAGEITNQIELTRGRAGTTSGGASGTLLYNTTSVRLNRGGLADALSASFRAPAVVPAVPWLDAAAPATPNAVAELVSGAVRVRWTAGDGEAPAWWLVQWRTSAGWDARLRWGNATQVDLPFSGTADRPDVVAVSALDRAMNASAPRVVETPRGR